MTLIQSATRCLVRMAVLAARIHRAFSALVLPEFQARAVKWIPTTNASRTLAKIMVSVE